ncbi:LGFP repeat-containing protein, partial [Corynebacterium tapiri]
MRSDKEPIPAGISKAEADKAEVREAKLTNPEAPTLNARPGCGVYWPTWFEVCGAIKNKYDQIGGPLSFLLLPKSNELTNPDGVGRRSEFINGFIYWHPHTGAHSVSLPVSTVWARHGWEGGFLGYPTTSDIPQGGDWYKQDFQGGHVYTHNALPPVQSSIQGAIYDKWQSMGAQNSDLGYPISDELTTPDGRGRYNVFEGGMIYWTPETGA